MVRDLVALGSMLVGAVAVILLGVALGVAGEPGQLALLVGGVLFLAGGAMGAQWDPQQVAMARERRAAGRAARRATAAEQQRTGRVQMPRLPNEPG